jgi:hypothetical protein
MKHKRDFHFKIYLDINSIISGEGRKGEGKGAGGEMTQTMYAHVNK